MVQNREFESGFSYLEEPDTNFSNGPMYYNVGSEYAWLDQRKTPAKSANTEGPAVTGPIQRIHVRISATSSILVGLNIYSGPPNHKELRWLVLSDIFYSLFILPAIFIHLIPPLHKMGQFHGSKWTIFRLLAHKMKLKETNYTYPFIVFINV